ncbi:uncharacterized protein CDAR_268941 [Caerostris darwini]|uniref:Uncharacterized protein n=1 Tax=Caerostris darwini TaxID=1538125 RepID=A0AAV4X3F7_9ARAC|nr:uncharacterized protein CDAR_268941 [Caerostris darwini]
MVSVLQNSMLTGIPTNSECRECPEEDTQGPGVYFLRACGTTELMELSYSNYEDYKPFLVPLEKLILTCHADFKKAGETQEECGLEYLQEYSFSPKIDVVVLYACYTIHTRIGLPDAEPDMVMPQATEYFLFDSVPQILNLHVKDPNFQLSIHHTRNVLNPYLYGSSLSKGNKNLFRLKKTVKHLLPPPYETKCKNYITEWEARGGNGPTTEKYDKLYSNKQVEEEELPEVADHFAATSSLVPSVHQQGGRRI